MGPASEKLNISTHNRPEHFSSALQTYPPASTRRPERRLGLGEASGPLQGIRKELVIRLAAGNCDGGHHVCQRGSGKEICREIEPGGT